MYLMLLTPTLFRLQR